MLFQLQMPGAEEVVEKTLADFQATADASGAVCAKLAGLFERHLWVLNVDPPAVVEQVK